MKLKCITSLSALLNFLITKKQHTTSNQRPTLNPVQVRYRLEVNSREEDIFGATWICTADFAGTNSSSSCKTSRPGSGSEWEASAGPICLLGLICPPVPPSLTQKCYFHSVLLLFSLLWPVQTLGLKLAYGSWQGLCISPVDSQVCLHSLKFHFGLLCETGQNSNTHVVSKMASFLDR